MGRKKGAAQALKWLVDNKINVPFVVADQNENKPECLGVTAKKLAIPTYFDDQVIYKMIENRDKSLENIDLIISYLHPRKIKEPLFKLGGLGCINFHPAPLPEYKSRAGYNTAILDQKDNFGVSAHFINSEKFDSGPIIQVLRFPIDPLTETVLALEKKSGEKLFELFIEIMKLFMEGRLIETKENHGGLYLTAKDLENLKIVNPDKDSAEDIDRKIRAFFFPPHHGAKIILAGKEYTLLNKEMLEYLATLINKT
ncbi:MAG: hypothetical protein A2817_03405 [Candidatus Yanofskybacteria bacterium RIFCSPHIGHO2_01_FULL_39_8b]|uniref:Formyl transferase N-terminal domain-containing protein n=1 Tax=Candidatus Yanofskybacteria bacterium RIFCSPHIGHO2_01_FULL_39_8b TaxID=1802659 RepID=A0A1F8EEZ4_9BACT|nr:MAG: hypothetical protein A2817_03405 [Candidatus Yanofskybacteria bacterium RIFCSPHIGHO2_01_FULL_39_8b]